MYKWDYFYNEISNVGQIKVTTYILVNIASIYFCIDNNLMCID